MGRSAGDDKQTKGRQRDKDARRQYQQISNSMNKIKVIRDAVHVVPQVLPHLSDRARWTLYKPVEYKTFDYMLKQIESLVKGVYSGNVGGQFVDSMANLISGQLTQAYQQAYEDEGYEGELPEYLTASLEAMILGQ